MQTSGVNTTEPQKIQAFTLLVNGAFNPLVNEVVRPEVDVIIQVLKYIPSQIFSIVSRELHQIRLWVDILKLKEKRITLRQFGCKTIPDALKTIEQFELRIAAFCDLPFSFISRDSIANKLLNVTDLQLVNCKLISGTLELLKEMKKLQILNLSHNGAIKGSELQHLKDLPLQDLNLEGCRNIDDEGFASLGAISTLTSLNLLQWELGQIKGKELHRLIDLPRLNSLGITLNEDEVEKSKQLGQLESLTNLNIRYYGQCFERLTDLKSLSNLNFLTLTIILPSNPQLCSGEYSLSPLILIPNLAYLECDLRALNNMNQIQPLLIKSKITSIKFTNCHFFTGLTKFSIVRNMPQLDCLCLSNGLNDVKNISISIVNKEEMKTFRDRYKKLIDFTKF